jgi:hypothetical protein
MNDDNRQDILQHEFRQVIPNFNPITPGAIKYFDIPNGIAEISVGYLFNRPMYGVTVIINGEHRHDLSFPFDCISKAYSYVDDLMVFADQLQNEL